MADKRKILKKGESIRLYSEEKKTASVFTVSKKSEVSESGIKYIGELGKKTVVLTELYPLTEDKAELMVRDGDNQLCKPTEKAEIRSITKKEAAALSEPYTVLKKYIKANKHSNSFCGVIPSFEILRGCDKKGKACGTAYICTELPSGDFCTLDNIISDARSHTSKNPEKTVFTILLSIYTLAGAVELLHLAGLVHGNIKSENFGCPVKKDNYRIETSCFTDIGFLSLKNENSADCADEKGAFNEKAASDLRTLGEILFKAIAVCDDVPGGNYREECYGRLHTIISSSKLIAASPVTANYKMQSILINIFRNTLGNEKAKKAYDLKMMLRDLKSAAVFLLPSEYNDDVDLYKEIKNIDKKLETYSEADSVFALKSLLFNHPLYLENRGEKINVTVVGFGVFGQKFLDLCLQAGQMHGKELDVTVVTPSKNAYKDEYLENRPELGDFFDIDKSTESEGNFGRISFFAPEEADERFKNGFSADSSKINRELVNSLMEKTNVPDYVFVAVGSEELNKRAAKAIMKYFEDKEKKCVVTFVYSEKLRADERQKNLIPVNVKSKIEDNKNFAEIERMAFNTFLLWHTSLNLNTDFKEAKKKFKVKYDYDSSISCVLSIKYKLYSLGIEIKSLSEDELAVAAEQYSLKINEQKEIFAGLVQAEHRRWVTEKLTDGWKCRKNLDECLTDSVSNKRLKVHPCIVKSRADFNLELYYKSSAAWNNSYVKDALLDDLDRMSVNLHRRFLSRARDKKDSFTLHGVQETMIRSFIKDDKSATLAFNELMDCLDEIWNFNSDAEKIYSSLSDKFTKIIKSYPADERNVICTNFEYIEKNAQPVMDACKKRDYKSTDKLIIKEIPFILTYRENISMFVPLVTGNNSARFSNIAHAAIINPSEITYALYIENTLALSDIKEALLSILPLFKKKNLRAKLKLLAICKKANTRIEEHIEKTFEEIKAADAYSAICETATLPITVPSLIADALEEEYGSFDLYEKNKSYLSAILLGSGFYNEKPMFTFNPKNKIFETSKKCKWLKYLKGSQALQIEDMFSLRAAERNIKESSLTVGDFKELWNIYSRRSWAWKFMCDVLKKEKNNDKITSFDLSIKDNNIGEFTYIIPVEYRDAYKKVINYLTEDCSIFEKNSRVEFITVDSCKVIIKASKMYTPSIRELFAVPEIFAVEKNIIISTIDSKVIISHNKLNVAGYSIAENDKKKQIIETLNELNKKHFIINFKVVNDGESISFNYATRQIKDILTCEGRVLELYVHSKLKQAGFDDVDGDYEFFWGNTEVKSELDCIVTQGYKSCVIECKATGTISQDYYFKLAALTERFAVNAIPVLVVSDLCVTYPNAQINQMQIERGRQLGVITVFDKDEIADIENTVRQILSGGYQQKPIP